MIHPYKCYSEIAGQSEAWQEAVEAVLAKAPAVKSFFEAIQPREIIFTGCTSPYYAGKSAAIFWQSALGMRAQAVPSSELILFPSAYYSFNHKEPALVVLSRSGLTTETIWAVEEFEKRFPGRTLFIGCAPGSTLEKLAGVSIFLPKAYEDTVPATRSLAAMYLATLLVGASISAQDEIFNFLQNAPSVAEKIIRKAESTVQEINDQGDFNNIFFLGSGPLYGIALEATLKTLEMTLSNTISFPFLESRHGPRSLIDDQTLVVGLYSQAGLNYEAQVMTELTQNHHATTVAITPNLHWETGKVSYHIPVDIDWPDSILGLSYLPVIHWLAYYRAVAKQVNPDTSRNLTPYIEIARM
jgi:glucosamine--fructose-6-phosphate aminotransferase (isomerizing)